MVEKPRLPPSPAVPLEREPEFILAQTVAEGAADEDFALLPPDCPSREQFSRGHEPVAVPPLPKPEKKLRFQFSLGDLLVVTVGVSLGLAGGTWMPAELFAAVLGLVTLLGLLLVHLNPPETHTGRLLWGTLVLAYVVAVTAAVARSW